MAERVAGWTRAQVLDALRAWAVANGKPPAINLWMRKPDGMPSKDTIQALFGSWSAAMSAAGFESAPGRRAGEMDKDVRASVLCANPHCDRTQGRHGAHDRCARCFGYLLRVGVEWDGVHRGPSVDEQAALDAVRVLAGSLGRRPKMREWQEWPDRPSGVPVRIEARYGSWGRFLVAAGLDAPPYRRRAFD